MEPDDLYGAILCRFQLIFYFFVPDASAFQNCFKKWLMEKKNLTCKMILKHYL